MSRMNGDRFSQMETLMSHTTYPGDDTMLTAILRDAMPRSASTKSRVIRRDGSGVFEAFLIQHTAISGVPGVQEQVLASRRFSTERGARRFLDRH